MKLFNKLLERDNLRVLLTAATKAGMELAKENSDLRVENIRLRREIERLRGESDD